MVFASNVFLIVAVSIASLGPSLQWPIKCSQIRILDFKNCGVFLRKYSPNFWFVRQALHFIFKQSFQLNGRSNQLLRSRRYKINLIAFQTNRTDIDLFAIHFSFNLPDRKHAVFSPPVASRAVVIGKQITTGTSLYRI